jgi:DNA-binding NarL/FixJ family response regulator
MINPAATIPLPTGKNPTTALAQDANNLSELTPREHEILTLLAQGLSDRGIGRRLWLTPKTVETHIRHVLTKLNLPSDGEHNRRVLAAVVYLTNATSAVFDPSQRSLRHNPGPRTTM